MSTLLSPVLSSASSASLAPASPPEIPAFRRNLRRRHWHSPAEILEILDTIAASDEPLREACQACHITLPTYYRWVKIRRKLEEKLAQTRADWDETASRGSFCHFGNFSASAADRAPLPPSAAPPRTAPPPHAERLNAARLNGERLAELERENRSLRETLVQLTMENARLRRAAAPRQPEPDNDGSPLPVPG